MSVSDMRMLGFDPFGWRACDWCDARCMTYEVRAHDRRLLALCDGCAVLVLRSDALPWLPQPVKRRPSGVFRDYRCGPPELRFE